jgi:hypothetical protein
VLYICTIIYVVKHLASCVVLDFLCAFLFLFSVAKLFEILL